MYAQVAPQTPTRAIPTAPSRCAGVASGGPAGKGAVVVLFAAEGGTRSPDGSDTDELL